MVSHSRQTQRRIWDMHIDKPSMRSPPGVPATTAALAGVQSRYCARATNRGTLAVWGSGGGDFASIVRCIVRLVRPWRTAGTDGAGTVGAFEVAAGLSAPP